jgi:hypothetical protein
MAKRSVREKPRVPNTQRCPKKRPLPKLWCRPSETGNPLKIKVVERSGFEPLKRNRSIANQWFPVFYRVINLVRTCQLGKNRSQCEHS